MMTTSTADGGGLRETPSGSDMHHVWDARHNPKQSALLCMIGVQPVRGQPIVIKPQSGMRRLTAARDRQSGACLPVPLSRH